jgi:hypothetical protein
MKMKHVTRTRFTELRPAQGNTVKIAEGFKTLETLGCRSTERAAEMDVMSIPRCTRPWPRPGIRCAGCLITAGLLPVGSGRRLSRICSGRLCDGREWPTPLPRATRARATVQHICRSGVADASPAGHKGPGYGATHLARPAFCRCRLAEAHPAGHEGPATQNLNRQSP